MTSQVHDNNVAIYQRIPSSYHETCCAPSIYQACYLYFHRSIVKAENRFFLFLCDLLSTLALLNVQM